MTVSSDFLLLPANFILFEFSTKSEFYPISFIILSFSSLHNTIIFNTQNFSSFSSLIYLENSTELLIQNVNTDSRGNFSCK